MTETTPTTTTTTTKAITPMTTTTTPTSMKRMTTTTTTPTLPTPSNKVLFYRSEKISDFFSPDLVFIVDRWSGNRSSGIEVRPDRTELAYLVSVTTNVLLAVAKTSQSMPGWLAPLWSHYDVSFTLKLLKWIYSWCFRDIFSNLETTSASSSSSLS